VIGEYWRRDSAPPGLPAWRSRNLRRGTSFRFPASHFRDTINHEHQGARRRTSGDKMTPKNASKSTASVTREQLIDLLNQDLAREFQAIIGYVNYSQVLKGAAYMNIAGELEKHATEELSHALIIANQIDYFGGMPTTVPELGEIATAEHIREILLDEQDHQIALATALGIETPQVGIAD
jgi:bacterioferritin